MIFCLENQSKTNFWGKYVNIFHGRGTVKNVNIDVGDTALWCAIMIRFRPGIADRQLGCCGTDVTVNFELSKKLFYFIQVAVFLHTDGLLAKNTSFSTIFKTLKYACSNKAPFKANKHAIVTSNDTSFETNSQ